MKTRTFNNMYWLVKREFWEHRGGFLWTPVITGGIFLLLNIMAIASAEIFGARAGIRIGGSRGLQALIGDMSAGDLSNVGLALDVAMYSSMALLSVVLGFVVLFYCLGALYDDRRDRSILFWKSLPLADSSTVVSKVVSAALLAPAIAIIVGVIIGLAQLLILTIVLSFHGVNVWHLLTLAHPFRVIANLVGSLPLYLLWALPAVGWFLLCSAWARSKPFMWAVALPVAAGTLVSWFGLMGLFNVSASWFWTNVVGRLLLSVFPGSSTIFGGPVRMGGGDSDELSFMDLGQTYHLLASANLWIGVVAGVVLIAGAIWLRRWRDDS